MNRSRSIAVICAALCFTSCSSDAPAGPAGSTDVYVGEPFAETVVLDDAALAALRASEPDGTLRFAGTPAALATVAADRVIVAGASAAEPRGLLRYVTEVASDAQGLVLATTEAPVQLAFRKLHVRFARQTDADREPLSFAPIGVRRSALSESITGKYWPAVAVDEYVFNGDGDPATPLDQVHVGGKLSGGVAYTFELSVDWGDVFALPAAVKECAKKLLKLSFSCSIQSLMPEAKIAFDVQLGADAELEMEGAAFFGYGDELIVAEKKLDAVPLGPLLFFPKIEVVAGFWGAASSQFALALKGGVALETGVSFSNKSGGGLTAPVLSHELSAPRVEAALAAAAKLRIGPRLTVALYDVAGIFASLYAVGELSADQERTPCFKLEGGVEGDVGFLVKSPDLPLLGSVTIAKFQKDLDIVKTELASGSCELPPPLGPPPQGGSPDVETFTHPTFTPWARAYPDVVDGFPHEDPGAQVEWAALTPTIDGRFTLAGSDARLLTKIDADGKLLWARRYAADVPFFNDHQDGLLLPGRVVNGTNGMIFVVAHPYTVLHVRADGSVVWARRFDLGDQYRETWMRFTDAVADGAGGLYVVGTRGSKWSDALSDLDGWLLHLDQHGQVLRSQRFGAPDWAEVPRRLLRFGDDVVVVGSRWHADGARWRGFVARFAADGALAWARELVADDCGGGYEQRLHPMSVIASRDGDLIVGASVEHSGYEGAVLKLKPDGALAWSSFFRAGESSHLGPHLTELVELPTSGYLAAGYYTGAQNAEDVWLAALDAVGKPLWARTYGGVEQAQNPLLRDDNYPTLQLTQDGGALVAAYSEALVGEDSLWAFKVAAKDGVIAFGGATSAASAPLAFAPGKTCVAAGAWAPAVAALAEKWIVQAVTAEQVSVADAAL